MKEVNLSIELENIVDFFGVNDANLEVIRRSFPTLKVVGRGHEIKIIGEPELVADAESKILKLMAYYRENGMLTPTEVDFILGN